MQEEEEKQKNYLANSIIISITQPKATYTQNSKDKEEEEAT